MLSGAALSAPLYSALLSGCTPKSASETVVSHSAFTEDQYSLLELIADTLLPETDTPSATQVGAVAAIDDIVGECYTEQDRQAYLDQFELLADRLTADGFPGASPDRQLQILQDLESADAVQHEAWMHVKQQIIAMYLTSETVAENQLNYLPVPGAFEPCIKLSETNGKAWAI